MKTVIGLLEQAEDAGSVLNGLQTAGFARNRVEVVVDEHEAWERLGGDQNHLLARDAVIGALLGLATVVPFGLTAGITGVTFLGYDPSFVVGPTVASILIGAVFGAILGHFVGVGLRENVTHLYTNGVWSGGALFVVRASDELASPAMSALRQAKVLGVRVHPSD